MDSDLIDTVKGWVDDADHVVFFTGAGMSAECGIPTFREAQTGFWARFDPMELASPEAFAKHPEQVLQWYAERRATALSCDPHAGYRAIASLEATHQVSVITQNVDRLHQRSGSTQVAELHGNLIQEHCQACGRKDPGIPNKLPPFQRHCSVCNGPLRPSIVWFGESLPSDALSVAEDALASCDVLFIVGTSAQVYPAAALPAIAKQGGARVVLINPERTEHANLADAYLAGSAALVLPIVL